METKIIKLKQKKNYKMENERKNHKPKTKEKLQNEKERKIIKRRKCTNVSLGQCSCTTKKKNLCLIL